MCIRQLLPEAAICQWLSGLTAQRPSPVIRQFANRSEESPIDEVESTDMAGGIRPSFFGAVQLPNALSFKAECLVLVSVLRPSEPKTHVALVQNCFWRAISLSVVELLGQLCFMKSGLKNDPTSKLRN